MRTFSAIVLATVVSVPAAHAADKPARPTEVHGVKLTSICITCGVVSDIRQEERVKGKGSGKGAMDQAAASGAVAGKEGGKGAKTVWMTTVVLKAGTTQTYQQSRNPGLKPGDVVIIQEGIPTKYLK